MAVTVDATTNLTEIYDAESNTGWTSDDAATAYTGWQREGTNCLGAQASQGTVYAYKTVSLNLTSTHVYSWMTMNGTPETKTVGGYCIVIGDGTNIIAYNVGGSDDLGFQVGAWSCFVLNTASPPTDFTVISGVEANLDFSAVTEVGVQMDMVNKAVGTVDNVFWDICRFGTGLIIKGGGVATEGTFAEIAAEDASTADGKAYGIIRELQTGVYGVQGQLEFGDSGSTTSTYFDDTNAIVVFEDRAVATTAYKLSAVGNATGTNSFVLGELSGTSGIKGCIIKSAGTAKVVLDFDDANVDTMKLYGCSFLDVGTTALPTVDSNKEALNCTWDSSGIITVSTMKVENCSFISADTDAITISSISHAVADCVFIAPTDHGVEITTIGTYTFDNLTFSGTDGVSNYDIENTTAGLVTINATNGANPAYYENTGGGSVTINNAVDLTVDGVTTDDEPTNYVRCRVEATTGGPESVGTELMSELADTVSGSNYKATTTYNFSSDQPVIIRARYIGYLPFETTGTITSAGLSVNAIWQVDPNYN